MTANRTTSSPLVDLRSLVPELSERCASVGNTTSIFDRIGDSLTLAEQHRATHVAGPTRFLATGEAVVLNQRLVVSALRCDGSEFPAELAEDCHLSALSSFHGDRALARVG